jgi:hypothetical protein
VKPKPVKPLATKLALNEKWLLIPTNAVPEMAHPARFALIILLITSCICMQMHDEPQMLTTATWRQGNKQWWKKLK